MYGSNYCMKNKIIIFMVICLWSCVSNIQKSSESTIFLQNFVAEYNLVLKDFQERQKKLDYNLTKKIDELVKRESSRLEQAVPMPFKPGASVRSFDKSITGEVVDCPVVLEVLEDENYHGPKFGPSRYYAIHDKHDEEILTCEGQIRRVLVKVEPNELQKDWGVENTIVEYWPDELENDD